MDTSPSGRSGIVNTDTLTRSSLDIHSSGVLVRVKIGITCLPNGAREVITLVSMSS